MKIATEKKRRTIPSRLTHLALTTNARPPSREHIIIFDWNLGQEKLSSVWRLIYFSECAFFFFSSFLFYSFVHLFQRHRDISPIYRLHKNSRWGHNITHINHELIIVIFIYISIYCACVFCVVNCVYMILQIVLIRKVIFVWHVRNDDIDSIYALHTQSPNECATTQCFGSPAISHRRRNNKK